jgi:hypothetical protein
VSPAGLSALVNGRLELLDFFCREPVQLIQGCYVVVDNQIVEQYMAPAPKSVQGAAMLRFSATPTAGQVEIRAGWVPVHPAVGERTVPEFIDSWKTAIADGAQWEVADQVASKLPLADGYNPTRLSSVYRTLWEGRFVRNGQPLKRFVYVARVATTDADAEALWPPTTPAPPVGPAERQ